MPGLEATAPAGNECQCLPEQNQDFETEAACRRELQKLEQRVSLRRAHLEQKV